MWRRGKISALMSDRERDDRPPVVAQVRVDAVERPEQRHREKREDAEVDDAHELLVDAAQQIEVLRPEEEPRVHPGARRIQGERGELVAFLDRRIGHRLGFVLHAGHLRIEQGCREEVVIVHAREAHGAFAYRLLRNRRGIEPFDLAVELHDALRLLEVLVRDTVLDVAQAASPRHRDVGRLAVDGDLGREPDHVGIRQELDGLPRREARRVPILEDQAQGRARRVDLLAAIAAQPEERRIQLRGPRGVFELQHQRARRASSQAARHQLDRLPLVVQVVLELPALDVRPAVGEDRPNHLGLDRDVALGRVAETRGRRGNRGGAGRRRCRRVLLHLRGARGWPGGRAFLPACGGRRLHRRLLRRRRRTQERLVEIQHQEGQHHRNQDALFHLFRISGSEDVQQGRGRIRTHRAGDSDPGV